ncbi:MAG: 30S ribosomal protein S18 [Candidatus Jacksonbacteria bacterium RIFOXYC2_FULL_44_29]|nr:MAG: 30S ribosomal protein S18 [Parcubacteria group bacterium GW2011_GWA2_42_28]KKT55901.1 MAG: 30S ribosomal protein S18 [Parcubacteria group bacterium GW2011_GWC2_44_22]OGY74515.1 MAG: 30S ribosomal protein S18 [Candidatus Jacksonbacteria bacterium RIFOXYA2_FULL_43_12]OGY77424.1 MAG: 30S ribosomal protein S18 [Candidatus Jacksonbacteria bacterium RIFOXYB2_FULL_44_15]OGY78196.1 MAG: 30S ribosomal protein S18 [Candidatus Jacksonbacteria bacterium RIFOXYD2_FULL_43_21]OGY80774.1 MAG: 30S ribo
MKEEIKHCYYCVEKAELIDYKFSEALNFYLSHYKKILPRRYTGLCAKHQRKVTLAIKQAREVALLPYVRTK